MSLSQLAIYRNDLLALTFCGALFAIYHWLLGRKERRDPTFTVQAVNRIARAAWVEDVMKNGKDILAVQTLRNSTMAATFLASTAVLMIIGVLTLSGQGDKLHATWHAVNVFGAKHAELWAVKLLLLMLDLFFAFFSFSMSIRVFNHVGYMINVPLSKEHHAISPAHVAVHLNRAGHYYSLGMRAYYYMVPLLMWLFGPLLLVVASIGLVAVMYRLDRAPRALAEDYAG